MLEPSELQGCSVCSATMMMLNEQGTSFSVQTRKAIYLIEGNLDGVMAVSETVSVDLQQLFCWRVEDIDYGTWNARC